MSARDSLVVAVDVDVDVGGVNVALDVDIDVFVDDHYVCSSVAGLPCNIPKARYPQNCGVTAPL